MRPTAAHPANSLAHLTELVTHGPARGRRHSLTTGRCRSRLGRGARFVAATSADKRAVRLAR
jgi:hypothetical protein